MYPSPPTLLVVLPYTLKEIEGWAEKTKESIMILLISCLQGVPNTNMEWVIMSLVVVSLTYFYFRDFLNRPTESMSCNKCKCYVLNFFFLFAGRVFSYLTKFLFLQKVVISPINTVDKLKGATGGGGRRLLRPPPPPKGAGQNEKKCRHKWKNYNFPIFVSFTLIYFQKLYLKRVH